MEKYKIELTIDQLSTLQQIVEFEAITRETDVEYFTKHCPKETSSIKLMQRISKEAKELSNFLNEIPF